jgi:hypothetical protein
MRRWFVEVCQQQKGAECNKKKTDSLKTHVAELVTLGEVTGQEPKFFLVGLFFEYVLVLVVL